jgi:hypothetical protein
MVAARRVMLGGVKLAGVAFVMLDRIKLHRVTASLPLARDVPHIMGGYLKVAETLADYSNGILAKPVSPAICL